MIRAVLLLGFPLLISCAKPQFIYRSVDKFQYVKIVPADDEKGPFRHPVALDPTWLRAALRSIHFSKKNVLMKDVEEAQLLGDGAIESVAPYLIEGFQKAGPSEVIVVSTIQRKWKYGVVDHRLTAFRAFVKEDELHLTFKKLYAKMLGDSVTKGRDRSIQEARDIRVSLEAQPGQGRIGWDPEEISLDLAYDFSKTL